MLTRGLRVFSSLRQATGSRFFGSLPAHDMLKMPALSPTMTEGTIVKWNKKVGEKVKAGEVMFEVETDKAVVGYEVQDDVYIAKILAQEGSSKIPLGQPVAILVSKADQVPAFKDFINESAPEKKEAKIEEAKEEVKKVEKEGERKFISPLAKNIAKENNLDYSGIEGSGPGGRVVKNDVLKELAKTEQKTEQIPKPEPKAKEDTLSYRDVPHTSMRKITADRLLQSKQTIPHYYLRTECNVDKLADLRKHLNETSEVKISVNDLVIKAASLACVKVPQVNSTWSEGSLRTFSNVDISIAVQTPKGLITPIIKNAHSKRIGEIAKEAKELAGTAKEGKLKPEQFIGGTFSISNLGMFGVKEFTAIINPPQACILAVGSAEGKVVLSGDGAKVRQVMTVTLSCDHRVVDGAVGGDWLKAFKGYVEEPMTMLL